MKRTELRRKSWMKRGTKPLPKRNPRQQSKRQKAYKAYLSSAAWRRLRQECFKRDGYQCTEIMTWMDDVFGNPVWMRCEFVGGPGPCGGLICDHLTYARFGHENLEDLRTLCPSCNARVTKSGRANWMAS